MANWGLLRHGKYTVISRLTLPHLALFRYNALVPITDSPFVRNTLAQLLCTGRTLFGKGVFSGTSHSSSPKKKPANDVIALSYEGKQFFGCDTACVKAFGAGSWCGRF
jgi:hypothetical protein